MTLDVAQRFASDRSARQLLIGLETGQLSEEEFEPQLAERLGVDASSLVDRLFAGSASEPEMQESVRALRRAGVRTGLISNSWGTRRYDRVLLGELFDAIVISGEEGMRKPAPEMYELGARRIGIAPEACVYVDDLPFNLEPAAALGMATVHHTSSEHTIEELSRLFGVELQVDTR